MNTMRSFTRIALVAFAVFSLSACIHNNQAGYSNVASVRPPPMTLAEINAHPDYKLQPSSDNTTAVADTCLLKKDGGLYNKHTDAATCLNQAVGRAASGNYYSWPDLLNNLNTFRSQLAAEVDAKKMTSENFDFRLAEKLTELTSQEINRRAQFANVDAQQHPIVTQQPTQSQPATALLQAFARPSPMPGGTAGARLQYMQQQPAINLHSTQCTTNAIGSTLQTNCNQY